MLSILGRPRGVCEGLSRRELLQAGGAGLLGLSLPGLLRAQAAVNLPPQGRAKNVIFLMLFGGPSQLETFDMKPDAPDKIRGPFKPIASRTPGLQICEHLPQLAAASDKFCVIRTMTHSYNDHSGAGHYIQTGRRWQVPIGGGFNPTPSDWPSMGSVVEYLDQHGPDGLARPLPSYAVVPNALGRLEQEGQYIRPGEYAGWLGRAYNPLTTRVDKRDLKDDPYRRTCSDEELTFAIEGLARDPLVVDRLEGRTSLLAQFDDARRGFEAAATRDFDRFRQRALALVNSGEARTALDIKREPDAMRDQYGRHLFGQSVLMARRLVEAGVRFVTVHYDCCDGYGWDSHVHSRDVRDHLLPTFDQACATLLTDLDQRGLLDETLVVALGEMGRTPQPTGDWGRGHWSTLFPALIAGAGVRGGTTYGSSDKDAALPVDHPVTPEDLAATIYHALGIDHELRVPDPQNRPVALVENGQPVRSIFG
ncbi:MAG: DUF1501 domain-containing protein [Planctomycetaceae bacterium]|nr:DUF1501 domain-containing protein [Planctomycetaceae bacterium]